MRYLALDVGERRIGVALSDETATLASGLETVVRTGGRRDVAAIAALVERHRPEAVLVGLPLNMDGTAGAQAEKVRTFVEELKARIEVPFLERDERLTTVEANEILRKSGVAWAQRAALLDKVSATVILQEFLDERKAVARGPARS
jgi:putative Holliday junction resolvase